MTAFADKSSEFVRAPVTLVELDIDKCSLTFGVGACTATAAAGFECFNTFKTCRDRANYDRDVLTLKFCSTLRSIPGQIVRPYVRDVRYTPTEINETKTIKGRVTVPMLDEPDADTQVDPYYATRNYKPVEQGTFWKKFIARNPNYAGRPIRIWEGFEGLELAAFQQTFEGILVNIRYSKAGEVSIEAEDLLGEMDKVMIPPTVNIKLSSAMTDSQTYAMLTDVSELYAAPGYVMLDKEMVYYTTIDTIANRISGLTRGAGFTTAAAHDEGEKVQIVYHDGPGNPFTLMENLLDAVGYSAGQIDSTSFSDEGSFYPYPNFEIFSEKPRKASELFFDMLNCTDAMGWVSEEQKITVRRIWPNKPGITYRTLTDGANFVLRSQSVDANDKSRKTRVALYYGRRLDEDASKVESYARGVIVINADSEAAANYGDVQDDLIKALSMNRGSVADDALNAYARAIASSKLYRRISAQHILDGEVDLKDSDIRVGDFVLVTTKALCGIYGAPYTERPFMVIKREHKGKKISLKLLETPARKWAYFAPASLPDFNAASNADKQYGYFCDSTGRIEDADNILVEGYSFV